MPSWAVVRRRAASLAMPAWFRTLWPPAEKHLPADVTVPGRFEQRIALRAGLGAGGRCVTELVPVIVAGHANLFTVPPWALGIAFLAVLQLVYAVWMINVPDWASAWVQMAVFAIVTTTLWHAHDLDEDHQG